MKFAGKFARRLYVGEGIRDSEKIKWKLKHNAGQLDIYVIALGRGSNQLEIFHCAFLKQRIYAGYPFRIVGLARGYEEALELVRRMTEEVYDKTGDCRIQEYFSRLF